MTKKHTSKLYDNELLVINNNILNMAKLSQNAINNAIKVFLENDILLAKNIILQDALIDKAELNLDELCLEIIARRQPLGQDLRFIVAVLKMVTDFERLGDLAVNISERMIKINESKAQVSFLDLKPMALCVQEMMSDILKALDKKDDKRAL